MSARLVLEFTTSEGDKSFSFANAKENVSASSVKALAQAMIANTTIFLYTLTAVKSAKVVVTSTSVLDLS